ncbi:ArsR/SmtB family transcription factor [Kordiimonas aestuarii]|uniref:ArsR/SmtB family transcription factor n=1 Tax=Kordiimonas aestuarii TaxID=1005925 RepID=UPI0021D120C8|nr:metalloregulator ArsR/SmtB family transcription factor [Kordiimonas aestuarii]
MTNLDSAFASLADPTRRAIISRLCEGPKSVSELSDPFDIALPSLLKHVRVLEESGLISSVKVGRIRTCKVETHALQATKAWLQQHITTWEERLDRMEAHIETMKRET